MKNLLNVYGAVYGRIEVSTDVKPAENTSPPSQRDHPVAARITIRKRIIVDNLYGVDIMDEATEIAKLRLFLALVSSAESLEDLEPLPNIDFNIMAGNSLIGLLSVDEKRLDEDETDASICCSDVKAQRVTGARSLDKKNQA